MSQYLLVTIGPVQSYIAQSRKTIDLFNSSKLVGDILKKIAKKIEQYIKENKKENKKEILLPNMDIEKYYEAGSVPNYFIVELDETNEEVNNIERKVRDYYKEELHKLIAKLQNDIKVDSKNKEALEQHASDIFDIYPVKVEADNYKKAYEELYERLERHKNIRIFNHYFGKGEAGRKCTICGQRNAMLYKNNNDNINLSEKEALCYSCCIKRIYSNNKDKKFPSTAGIAVMGWKKKINNNNNNQGPLDSFLVDMKKLFKDSDLYEECYYYEDVVLNEAKKENKNNTEKCKGIFKKYKEELFSKYNPTKYYALIKGDIDDLGKWMAGKYLEGDIGTEAFLESQKELSESIIEFGENIEQEFTQKQLGETIYTGGDDFLLFVTLEELFNAVKLLDNGIEKINKGLKNYNRILTMSKSITIAHYTTPLQKVINITTSTLDQIKEKFKEREASRITSKNGMAVTFITRSNTYRTAMFKNTNSININTLKAVVNAFKENVSKSFINQLEMNFRGLDATIEYEEMLTMKKIFKSEIRRILKRKSKEENDFNIQNTLLELLSQGTIKLGKNDYRLDYNNIFNFLHIADNISRQLLKGE